MVLHDSKFEYLAYRTASSKLLEELPFTSQDLTPASSVKDLGVHLSPDMKWSLQATIAAQNAEKWPTVCSLPFTRVLSVAESNTPVQYGIHPQCKTLRNWNTPNVLSLATLLDARICHIGKG